MPHLCQHDVELTLPCPRCATGADGEIDELTAKLAEVTDERDELLDRIESIRGERDAAQTHTNQALEAEQKSRAKVRELREMLRRTVDALQEMTVRDPHFGSRPEDDAIFVMSKAAEALLGRRP